ncbi:MAG: type IVB secretion system protein IcmW [Gammaproteobacteria bacterium]|nr:type IVB secretion system protein IcmW [Gammaproteobacteria bacterium]
MPKLDLKASHEYWNQFNDPMIYRVVAFMESVEDWTKDGDPQLEAAIDKLGDALEALTKFKVSEEENFIKLATFLKMPRLLRILQTVDTIEPGSASKILMFAEEKKLDSPINFSISSSEYCLRTLTIIKPCFFADTFFLDITRIGERIMRRFFLMFLTLLSIHSVTMAEKKTNKTQKFSRILTNARL